MKLMPTNPISKQQSEKLKLSLLQFQQMTPQVNNSRLLKEVGSKSPMQKLNNSQKKSSPIFDFSAFNHYPLYLKKPSQNPQFPGDGLRPQVLRRNDISLRLRKAFPDKQFILVDTDDGEPD